MAVLSLPYWGIDMERRWRSGLAQSIYFFVLFRLRHTACGILVSWPGIEPTPPALKVRSLNHWTVREVPQSFFCSSSFHPTHLTLLSLPFSNLHIMLSFSVFVNVIILVSGVSKSWTRQVRSLPLGKSLYISRGARQVRQTDQSQQVVCQSIQLD